MLNSRDPVDITLWTRRGEIQHYTNCVSLKYDYYNIKLLNSGEIRRVRDVCIFEINGCEVML